MITDARLEPEYVYEENPPEVEEIQCPEEQFFSCAGWRTRGEMLEHYKEAHPEYGATDIDAIEVLFEQERSRRHDR